MVSDIPPPSSTDPRLIHDGIIFDTPFEEGCKVLTEPDGDGEFLALDSTGVECSFSISGMLLYIRDPEDH